MATDGPDRDADVGTTTIVTSVGIGEIGPLGERIFSGLIGELSSLNFPKRRVGKDAGELGLKEDGGRITIAGRAKVGRDKTVAQQESEKERRDGTAPGRGKERNHRDLAEKKARATNDHDPCDLRTDSSSSSRGQFRTGHN